MARSILIKFVGESQSLARATKDIVSGLGDVDSATTSVSDGFRQMAARIDSEARELQETIDVLGAALGTELVADIERNGGSVQQLILDLQRGGITMAEMRGEADQLAPSLRELVDAGERLKAIDDGARQGAAGLEQLDSKAESARGKINQVRDASDQSGSVLANMVGNSVQDLAGLGGVAGTAGMALGQLGEYATEGNISLSNFAKVAGPMAALAAGVAAVSLVVKAAGADSREAAREAEFYRKQLDLLADAKYREAAMDLAEEWENSIPILGRYGLGLADVVAVLNGNTTALDQLKAKYVEVDAQYQSSTEMSVEQREAILAEAHELDNLITNLEAGRKEMVEGTKARIADKAQIDATVEALIGYSVNVKAATTDLADLDRQQAATEATTRALEQSTKNYNDRLAELMGWLDSGDAWDNMRTKMWNYHADTDVSEQETRDYIRALGDMVSKLEGVPDETKARLIAELRDEDIATVEAYLQQWGKGIDVPVRFKGQNNVGFDRGDLDREGGGKAQGGPTASGTRYPIMERGAPEVYTDSSGRRYLLTGDGPGRVDPLGASDGGRPILQVVIAPKGDIIGEAHITTLVRSAVDEALTLAAAGGRFPGEN